MFTDYKLPLIISVLLHGVLIALSALSWRPSNQQPMHIAQSAPEEVEIVKAVAVEESAVQAEMQRIQQEREKQREAEQARQRELEKQAEAARKQREQEAKRLAEMQAEAKKLKEQQQAEQKRLAEVKAKAEAEARKRKQEEQRLAELERQREAEAKRRAEEEKRRKEQLAAEKERQLQEVVQRYGALIRQAIGQQWIVPDNVDPSLSSTLLIRLAPGGAVTDVQVIKSSGNPQLDRSAMAAVYKASPLPVPQEKEWFEKFREVRLTVRPEEIVSR